MRPADPNETAECWRAAIERKGPVAMILTRQKMPVLDRHVYPVADGVRRGAYVLAGGDEKPDLILIATGSEVQLALGAREKLAGKGVKVRVVSMPSQELFLEQDAAYRDEVLPPDVTRRLSIEAGSTAGWYRWVGSSGGVMGIDRFGASAPGSLLFEKFGFTVDAVVEKALAL